MKSLAVVSVATLFAALALGCSSAPEAESGSDEGAAVIDEAPATDSVKAYLEAKAIKGQVGAVAVDAQSVAVVLPNDLRTGEKITAALPQTAAFFASYAESGRVTSSVEPSLNERGLLSLHLSIQNDTIAQPAFATFTFDLRTGARLAISDVLNADGLRAVVAACEAATNADPQSKAAASFCQPSVEPSGGDNGVEQPVAFELTKEGLLFRPRMASAWYVFTSKGVLVPWAKLKGNIRHAGVIALAR